MTPFKGNTDCTFTGEWEGESEPSDPVNFKQDILQWIF